MSEVIIYRCGTMRYRILAVVFVFSFILLFSSLPLVVAEPDADILIGGGPLGILVDIIDIRENATTRLQTYTYINFTCFIHGLTYVHCDNFSIYPGYGHGAIFSHPYLLDFGIVTIKVIAGNVTIEKKGLFISRFVFPIYMTPPGEHW